MLLLIQSMRIEKHIKTAEGNNQETTLYIYNCKSNSKSYELVIDDDSQSSAHVTLREVKMFSGISFLCKENLLIEYNPDKDNYDNCLFNIGEKGIQIKYDYLIPTIRLKEKRPVWIFVGQSALGKSYLSSMLANEGNLTKYETDISAELPQEICEDMIIVGNKYKFSLKDIKERIYGEHEAIVVDFKKYESEEI